MKRRRKVEKLDVLKRMGMEAEADKVHLDTTRTDMKPTPRGGITQGLEDLSVTRSQLLQRRRKEFRETASKMAPNKPLGKGWLETLTQRRGG
jgi:hypothetical protein